MAWSCRGDTRDGVGADALGSQRDEGGAPISGAQVVVAQQAASVTDASGQTGISASTMATGEQAMSIAKAGYETIYRRLTPTDVSTRGEGTWRYTLRPVDVVTSLVLPAEGEAAATVVCTRSDAGATLTLPPGSLVTAAGEAAVGEVAVAMT